MDCCEKPMAAAGVVCPKPRRPEQCNNNSPSITLMKFHIRNDADSTAGVESPGVFLRKTDYKAEGTSLSTSPPFLSGSPPCRTTNPLIRDAQFGVENVTSLCKSSSDSALSGLAYSRKQPVKKQAAVRVEGFNCPRSHVFAMT